jgi:hypothetical protein
VGLSGIVTVHSPEKFGFSCAETQFTKSIATDIAHAAMRLIEDSSLPHRGSRLAYSREAHPH